MATTLKNYKAQQKRLSTRRLSSSIYPRDLTIVAEGDSWFDYPLKKDVLDFLIEKGYAVKRFSKYGDTLENMVYGSEYEKRDGMISHKGPKSLQAIHNAVRTYSPSFFLFSAGGNDIVGSEISTYLNHANSKPKNLLNRTILNERITQMSRAIEYYIKGIHRVDKRCQILMDGYDYAKVDGRGYKVLGIKAAGPWIEPSMARKNIINKNDQRRIIKHLVDNFNDMLSRLSSKHKYFHHVDIRGQFGEDKDWHNEIHLNNRAYKRLSSLYINRMSAILSYDPCDEHSELIIA